MFPRIHTTNWRQKCFQDEMKERWYHFLDLPMRQLIGWLIFLWICTHDPTFHSQFEFYPNSWKITWSWLICREACCQVSPDQLLEDSHSLGHHWISLLTQMLTTQVTKTQESRTGAIFIINGGPVAWNVKKARMYLFQLQKQSTLLPVLPVLQHQTLSGFAGYVESTGSQAGFTNNTLRWQSRKCLLDQEPSQPQESNTCWRSVSFCSVMIAFICNNYVV